MIICSLLVVMLLPAYAYAGWARTYTAAGNDVGGFIWPNPTGANNFSLWGNLSSTATPAAHPDYALFARLTSTGAFQSGKTVRMTGKHNLWIEEQTDGKFFVGGTRDTSSTSTPARNVVWAKYNADWTPAYAPKQLGGTRDDNAYFFPTADGGYIAIGESNSYGASASDKDILLIKINSAGAVQWSKALHIGDEDNGGMITELTGGGYVFSGTVKSTTGTDLVIFKISSTGTITWKKKLAKAGFSTPNQIFQTNNGDIILMADWVQTQSFGQPGKIMIFRFSSAGVVKFQKSYAHGTDLLPAGVMSENPDGSFVLSSIIQGINMTTFEMSSKMLLTKLTSQGALASPSRTLSIANRYVSAYVLRMANGDLLMSGTSTVMSSGMPTGNMDILYGKINPSTLLPVWSKTFGGPGMETGGFFENGTGYFLTGMTDSFPTTASVIKTFGITLDSNGSYANCPPIKAATLVSGPAGITVADALYTITDPTVVTRNTGPAQSTAMTVNPQTLTTGQISTCPVTQ